jgi:hypothetical protein
MFSIYVPTSTPLLYGLPNKVPTFSKGRHYIFTYINFYFGELSKFSFLFFFVFVIDQSKLQIVVGMGGIIGMWECGGRAPN